MNHISNIDSYDIAGKGMPDDVEKKVRLCHIAPLEKVRDIAFTYQFDIGISMKSGYRSKEWEKNKGRSGYSEHTYSGLGAVDLTCEDFKSNRGNLLDILMRHTDYTRLAVYDSFIHCDYKNPLTDRWVYSSSWVRQYRFTHEGPIF